MIGQTISHYRILEQLGAGGMGVVYKAEDLKLKRTVALKFLPPELTRNPEAKARFSREAQAAAALAHPNICTIHAIEEADDQLFIAMEYVAGQTLKDLIGAEPLPLNVAIAYASQLAEGLQAAHERGIVHRDIKSANIMVTPGGQIKIMDFGLARTPDQTQLTRTGTTLGTVAYMSPEQARGEEVDTRSDIYSLGVVLYVLLTGKQPFPGDHEAAVLHAIICEEPKPLRTLRPDLPRDLQHVIDKALAKDLAIRYQTAEELMRDLEQIERGETVTAAKRRRAFPLRTLLIATFGAAVVVAGYLLYTRVVPSPEPEPQAISANVLAVFPFTVRGDEELAYMGEGIVDLLSVKLDNVAGIRSVDPTAITGLIKQSQVGATLGVEQYRTIAAQAGAGLFITGNLVEAGGQLNIRASLFETRSGQDAATDAAVVGPADQFLTLVDDLAADLVVDRIVGTGKPVVQLAKKTTFSYEALKAFLQAERLYRAGAYAPAVEACQRAVAADSTFALAYYRMLRASHSSLAKANPDATEKAMLYRYRLPENERRLLEATVAWMERGDAEEGIDLLRRNISLRPDDLESRCVLGELLFHFGRRQGMWLEEARANFERILYYDPDHLDALSQLHWLAGLEGHYEECTRLLERRLELEPEGDHAPSMRAELAFAGNDTLLQREALTELQQSSDFHLWAAVLCVAWIHGELEGASKVAELMTEPSRPPVSRAEGHLSKAQLAVARGRWQEADRHLTAARQFDPAWTIRTRGNLSLTPPLTMTRAQLATSLDMVVGLDDTNRFEMNHRPFLAGILNARLGDQESALHYGAELDSIKMTLAVREEDLKSSDWIVWTEDLARTIRAEVAWLQGDLAGALDELEQTRPAVLWYRTLGGLIESATYQRYLRGVLLAEAGRYEESLRWLGTLGQGSGDGFVYFAAKHLEMGKVYEKMGETDRAVEHYQRFLSLWDDCDSEFQSLVEEVRTRISRLEL